MAASTLNETDTGVYVDGAGDTVLVFTDKDGKTKSLILQEKYGQNFGMLAHTSDGYYDGDYAPYTPVRLFLPNIERPGQPTYTIEEIERDGEHDGAWIGDQGTIIIHRSDGNPPDRTLHAIFTYDTHYELKFAIYDFSPIYSRFHTTEKFSPIMPGEHLTVVPVEHKEADMSDHTTDTFHDKLDDLQQQINEMKEQASNALSIAQTAEDTIDIIASRVSTLEQENKTHSNARDMPDSEGFWRDTPDSEGFWRDIDDDVWVRDAEGNTRLISKGYKQGDNEIYNQSLNYGASGYGPFVKIDNPFIQDEDHAE